MSKILEFSEEPKQVLSCLITSKEENLMIGINSAKLDPSTLITVVKEIVLDSELLFLLSPYDSNGQMLNCTLLKLSEIHGVVPFTSEFKNPFLKEIDGNDAQ